MMKILQIESSAQVAGSSFSRRISQDVVDKLKELASGDVTLRDLAQVPIPHINGAFVEAMFLPQEQRSAEQALALALSETLIQELEGADAIVIGCPMYNYSIPSALKAWLDHIIRARRTFIHTPDGPRGLLRDRPVYIVTSSGGVYSDGPGIRVDFLSPYLAAVLGKIGLKDLRFLHVEGVALGGDVLGKALETVKSSISTLAVSSAPRDAYGT